MSTRRWCWIGAKATGTSHVQAGSGCDDFGACVEIHGRDGRILLAVASDGAGSAKLSFLGSRIVVRYFCQSAAEYLRQNTIAALTADVTREWLDNIRDRIAETAIHNAAVPRDFAATLVAAIVGPRSAAFVHIGDGACVFRRREEEGWEIPSWPAQGEYAATTYFVTDDPEPDIVFTAVDDAIDELAVFTDGMERLILHFETRTAFEPFFKQTFPPLRTSTVVGRDRKLSGYLAQFLTSASVNERTDDDKTLLLARRSA